MEGLFILHPQVAPYREVMVRPAATGDCDVETSKIAASGTAIAGMLDHQGTLPLLSNPSWVAFLRVALETAGTEAGQRLSPDMADDKEPEGFIRN
jgi:hypothetical protein